LAAGVPARLTAAQGRKFALTVGLAFIALGALVYFWRHKELAGQILALLGVALIVAGLVAPTALTPVERAWMKLAHLLSRVTTPIFMGLVYFVVLTPIGLLMRLFGKNPLVVQRSGGGVWVTREATRGDIERQF
jgi:hypothetical protein